MQFKRLSDPHARELQTRLRSLKGAYAGQRAIVMGNGPSLNKMDLSLFRDEYVWGSNRCDLLFDRVDWRPSFYVSVDATVVPDIAPIITQLIHDLPQTRFFFPLHFRVDDVLRSADNVYWYFERGDRKQVPDDAFTTDASEWVARPNTVTIAAMQLAAYLGFNPIYLIGCDTSYRVPDTVQVVKEAEGYTTDYMSTEDDDPNHFDPRYFGKGRKWRDPNVEGMIEHYTYAKAICDRMGVQVYNATVGGNLEVFPRVDYRSLFDEAD
ncbi:MAG: 6-hydroxymethylpterin diphosphokinase MptE-like protein [Chloroflexota bacterium]